MAARCGLKCGEVKEKETAETSENIGVILVPVVLVPYLFRNAIFYLASVT